MTTSPTPEQNVARRVLNRIADEHLVPRPQWEFAFRNYFFWGLGVVAVLFGALAFSAMLFTLENADWQLALVTHGSLLEFFFDVAPLLWVGALALFLLIGYANVRRTNHGYRYSLSVIALGAVLTSLVLGTALYARGFGSELDTAASRVLPFHTPILVNEESWWLAPQKGLLGGSIVSVDPALASFELRDFNGELWKVDGADLRTPDLTAVARGGTVRIVGIPTTATSSVFHACFVLAWQPQGAPAAMPPPPPFAAVSSTSERSSAVLRSEVCRGIRPYAQLRAIDGDGF